MVLLSLSLLALRFALTVELRGCAYLFRNAASNGSSVVSLRAPLNLFRAAADLSGRSLSGEPCAVVSVRVCGVGHLSQP